MEFFSVFALIMLTLVGYSSGIALTSAGKERHPTILDLIIIALLWVTLFSFRPSLGRWWTILAGVVGAGIVAGIYTTILRSNLADKEEAPPPDLAGMNPLRQLWERWKHFAEKMGHSQGQLLMGFFYFIVVTPFGIGNRLLSDPLNHKQPFNQTGWSRFQNNSVTIEESKRQY